MCGKIGLFFSFLDTDLTRTVILRWILSCLNMCLVLPNLFVFKKPMAAEREIKIKING